MVFSSLTFLCIFLPLVFLGHQLLPSIKAKNALLIVASLLFYAYGEPIYVLLMLASTIANWAFGILLKPARTPTVRKAIVCAALFVNLSFLGIFKYALLLVTSINTILGSAITEPYIALPIGISFYTFQAISYVVDVYRNKVEAQKNYARVLLYISFFPQLIAGPIVKYHDIEEQLSHRRASPSDIACGLRRFCIGLGKKVLIANTMGATVDVLYSAPESSVNILVAWLAGIAYAIQIYFDFSGYSDMAIGMAAAFGFRFKENFRLPYTSTTIKEFWRRWHISLSTWFREYLYIPLGGNRKGRLRTVANKMIVFLLCGLWHGAAWTFVVWGLIHGLFLLLEEYIPLHKLPKPIGWIYTMLVVCVAFVLFRAQSFSQGSLFIQQMFVGFHFEYASIELFLRQLNPVFVITLVIGIMCSSPLAQVIKSALESERVVRSGRIQALGFIAACFVLVLSVLSLSSGGYNPFIYFRF